MTLPDKLTDWPDDARELYEERAAILEFDAGNTRQEAERRAEQIIREALSEQRHLL